MRLGKTIKKAMNQLQSAITKPFTHSARHKIEDEYHRALDECNRQEYDALNKLYNQRREERDKIALQKKVLEDSLKSNTEQFILEENKLTQYLLEKEKAFKDTFESIRNNFESLRAGLKACVSGENEIIKVLLQKSSDLKRRFMDLNPLHFAADNNQASTVRLLCEHGADIHKRYASYGTALEIAEERGQEESAKALKLIIKQTELFWKAADAEDYAAMKNALENGAAINGTYPEGYNALEKAIAYKQSYTIIHWLIASGADYYLQCTQLSQWDGDVSKRSLFLDTTQAVYNIPNSAIILAEEHPDWRVKDLLLDKLGIEAADLISECTEHNHVSYTQISNHLACALGASFQNNANARSTFVSAKGKKYFVSVGSKAKALTIIIYDFEKMKWNQEFFSTGIRVQYSDSSQNMLSNLWKNEQMWQTTNLPELKPIQLQAVKASEGQENLYLLTQKLNRRIVLLCYKPELSVWKACNLGPKLEESGEIEFELSTTENGDTLFLIVRSENSTVFQSGILQFWSYDTQQDKWDQHQNNFSLVASQPQVSTLRSEDGKTLLFLLVERYISTDSAEKKHELWSYELERRLWILHPTTPWSNASLTCRKVQMKAVQVAGETQLCFSYRFEKGMQLWNYHLKSKLWEWHPGGPNWPYMDPWEEMTERDVVQMQILPGHEQNTNIIMFLRQSKLGIECHCYHPLSKRWLALTLPAFSSEQLCFRENYQKIQMHVEQIQKQYRLVIFSASYRLEKEPQVHTWSYPLNIKSLEKELTENCTHTVVATFSDAELQKMRSFVNNIFKASQSLLSAARAGDWPTVFASLEQGADVYATESEGYNALQLALRHPLDLTTLKRLLHAGIALNHRANIQKKTSLELARGSNLIEVHDYIANLLEKPVLNLTQDIKSQFHKIFQKKTAETQDFLNKRKTNVRRCQAILCYYRLKVRTNPYALYIWPGMLLLGETLSLLPSILKKNDPLLARIQAFFVRTYAFHQALCSVGIEHAESLQADPRFNDTDWTYVINGVSLKEAAELYAQDHDLPESSEEVQKYIFTFYEKQVIQGIKSALTEFSKIIELNVSETSWIQQASQWLSQQLLQSPLQLKQSYKNCFQQHLDSSDSIAKEASQAGLLLLPPKLNVSTEIKVLDEEQRIITEKLKQDEQDFIKEKEELEIWLIKREEECIKYIQELNILLNSNQKQSDEIEAQFNQAIAEVNNQFSHFRQVLGENKEEALRKVQKQAFKSLVIMAGACCVAHLLAPVLMSALGSASAAGLSAKTATILETLLKGSIAGGINGGFSKQNILKSTLKGAGFAALGYGLGDVADKFIDPTISTMHSVMQVAMPIGIEAAVRTKLEGGKISENVISAVGTGLLFSKAPMEKSLSQGFMYDLRMNVFKAFVGGGIYSVVAKEHFGSSVAAAGVTAVITTGAVRAGGMMASPFLDRRNVALAGRYERTRGARSSVSRDSEFDAGCDPCEESQRSIALSNHTTISSHVSSKSDPRAFGHGLDSRDFIHERSSFDEFLSDNLYGLRHSRTYPYFNVGPIENRAERILNFFIPSAHADTSGVSDNTKKAVIFSQKIGKNNRCGSRKENVMLMSKKYRNNEKFKNNPEGIDYRMVGPRAVVNEYHDYSCTLSGDSRSYLYPKQYKSNNASIFERRDAINAELNSFQQVSIRMGAFASIIATPFNAVGYLTESANLLDDSSSIRSMESHYAKMRSRDGYNIFVTFKNCIVDGHQYHINQSLESFKRGNYFTCGFQAGGIVSDMGASFIGGISAMKFTYRATRSLGRGALIGGRNIIIGTEDFLTTHNFKLPITFQFSTHLNSGFPVQGVKFRKLFEFSSNKQHARNLEKILGASLYEEHIDLVAGSGGSHVYENFARARDAAKLRAGLRDDAVPFLQKIGPLKNNVYTGMESAAGTKGWRLDFDPRNSDKAVHINWWYKPDSKKKEMYKGMIRIEGGNKDIYWDLISHFPKKKRL